MCPIPLENIISSLSEWASLSNKLWVYKQSYVNLLFCLGAKSCPNLQTQGLQHTRLLCSPISSGVCSNSVPLSQWHCLIISSSAACFFFCFQSFPTSGSSSMSQLFASGKQKSSASASVFPIDIQEYFV